MTIRIDDQYHPMWELRPVEAVTRRERIATAVLPRFTFDYEPEHAAKRAVRFADALIAELDKEPTR